ncbi:phosphodiester glycosidase family protein [Robinsoniella sp. KNHs210]|uniref:phosphodiester glycosidase family protein n=1 Tax=Robinsoniella sp. KNHs210 TaxID=1469950 RepID=UPI00048302DD|nr:phosphodiester glycosidase family protein [Robinsoniella sp. KNHs210]
MKYNRKKTQLRMILLLFCVLIGFALSDSTAQAAKRTGWKTVKSSKYYYVSGKKVKNKWKKINKKWYYFDRKGKMLKKRWVGDYYLGSKGYMLTNRWIKSYFVGEDGKWIPKFRGGWQKIGGKWYYYTKSGKKKTGWITSKGDRYFLDSKGVMKTKWTAVKKKNYYFSSSGALQKNTWLKKGKYYYYVNSKGVMDASRKMNTKSINTATYLEYRSSTLSVKINKKQNYSSVYWVARIKTSSPKQLKSALSYGTYGGTRQLTSQAVPQNGGIIGVNGSAFDYASGQPSPKGMCIKNGKIYGNYATSYTTMAIKKDGTMFTPPMGLWGQALLDMGVKDTYNFSPVLINNGIALPPDIIQNLGVTSYKDPRTVVGMIRPNDYVLLVADGRKQGYSLGLNHYEIIAELQKWGCRYAYNLDGGGSTTLYYDGKVLNRPSGGAERPCADFLYFTN